MADGVEHLVRCSLSPGRHSRRQLMLLLLLLTRDFARVKQGCRTAPCIQLCRPRMQPYGLLASLPH